MKGGPGHGQFGEVVAEEPSKTFGSRFRVVDDLGSPHWYAQREQHLLLPAAGPEAKALRAEYEQSLGSPDLSQDIAYARAVAESRRTLEFRRAIDRLLRHHDAAAIAALLEFSNSELTRANLTAGGAAWVAPSLRALRNAPVDPIPSVVAHLKTCFDDPQLRHVCGPIAKAFADGRDPRLVEALRELTKREAVPDLLAARLAAEDEMVYSELAESRISERDGHLCLAAGDLSPEVATRLLAAAGERGARVTMLDIVRGGHKAFDGIDLQAWLAWPELARFTALDLSEAFRGKKGLDALAKSQQLAPNLALLDVSACDVGQTGCRVLGKAKWLANLEELRIDAGDYDRSKWTSSCLDALFPKKGGTLGRLATLSIRGWDVGASLAQELRSSGRAPLLRRVQLSSGWVELE
ncbi:MAG: hypothetical protein R3B89_04410 [Polyangiaceae bacterium]